MPASAFIKNSSHATLSLFFAVGLVSTLSGCGILDKEEVVDLLKDHRGGGEPDPDPCAKVRCKGGTECVVNKTKPPTAQCVPVDTIANSCAAILCEPGQTCVTLEIFPPQGKCVDAPAPEKRCISSNECESGLTCSTERGDCLSCGAPNGSVCPAVCFGVCEKAAPQGECQSDSDCKLVDDYCGACNCLAVSPSDPVNSCSNPVNCFAQPCQNRTALCQQGQCVVQDAGRPGTCTTEVEGSESSCKSASTWKQYAFERCQAKGQTLTNLWPGTSCGGDNSRYMKYECCPQR